MSYYLDIHSSYMKMKVKGAISNYGGEISNVLSPEVTLIVSDKVSNEKPTCPFNGSPAAGTRGYKILQKASELNQKSNVENNVEMVARKYDIAISSCEKFLASLKDRLSIDKRYHSEGVQEWAQKETNLTKTVKRIKSGLKLCKLAVRRTNAARFFNRNTKKLQTSSSPEIEQKLLEKNFIKVEDCSRQMRPLYKSNVFRKLVFCRCSCSVFHSVHVAETKPPKTSSYRPRVNARVGELRRTKYLDLSGHCEICDWSFHCMWTHITGEMHKENVCQSSYSRIHDLLAQLPSLDNFLNKYCAETNFTGTNAGDIRLQSSDGMSINCGGGIEYSNIETTANIVTSSGISVLSPNKNEIDFNTTSGNKFNSENYSHGKAVRENLNPCETKAVPLGEQTDLAPLLPDQQVKLSTYNCHVFKGSFSEFLIEKIRKHLQFIHLKNGHHANAEYRTDLLSLDESQFYKNACIDFEDPMKADILGIAESYYKIFSSIFLSLKCSNLNTKKFESMYNLEIKRSNITSLKPHNLFCSFEIQNSQKNETPREKLKLNINNNFYRLPNNLMSEYTDRLWSEIIKLLSIDSSLANDTYLGYIYKIIKHTHTESEKSEQNEIADSIEIVNMAKLFSFLPTSLLNFNCPSAQKTASRCKQSPKIEPISDACNNSQSDTETSVMQNTKNWLNKSKMAKQEERRAAKVKNEMTMKEMAMLKINDEQKVRLKGNKDVILPECIVEKKAGIDKAKIKTEVEENMEKPDDSLAEYSYRKTLNTSHEQLKIPNAHRKKLSLKEKSCHDNGTCISADSVNKLKLECQERESSSSTLTGSRSKRRERKKLQHSTSTNENSSSFSVSSFSRKTDDCTDRMYPSLLAQSSSLRSYRRLDKLVIKKTEVPAVGEISSPSACIGSGKRYSLSTSKKCTCTFNMTLHRNACPTCLSAADYRVGNATSGSDRRRATEGRKISLDKQFNETFSGAVSKDDCNINVQTSYQSSKAFESPQKCVQKTIRNLKVKDTCSENWNIKFNQGLRMTLCRI